ncbi:PTS sugar transporter subunit IIB [Irregularibacter muris]|uniref:PTS sugar transporter subunit IIB n=1 Tax=Irregularibacter muris TaxID=1796619 RepID=A0AAE3KZG8_9FIRM|nr:PTS sugar transporter subunit IIB [Irregularibacter muris]MCR1898277.1 PTS sugar transporter subunit IIB [Irregularibacter muris]
MGEIVLARIDDRLIHGQVMTAWLNYTSANRITIIDEEVAKDSFMKTVLEMAIPPGIKLDICDIEGAVNLLTSKLRDKDRVIILVKRPETIYELIEKGVDIGSLNIGGMGAKPGRKKFYKNISASSEEKETMKRILDKGVKVAIQIIPDNKEILVDKLL